MSSLQSPREMEVAAHWSMLNIVWMAVDDATPQGTLADDVERLVWGAAVRPIVLALGLGGGLKERLRGGIEGPNLDRFIEETEQKWGVG